jgi:hypothetical protein
MGDNVFGGPIFSRAFICAMSSTMRNKETILVPFDGGIGGKPGRNSTGRERTAHGDRLVRRKPQALGGCSEQSRDCGLPEAGAAICT